MPAYFDVKALVDQPFSCVLDEISFNLFIPAKAVYSVVYKRLTAGQVVRVSVSPDVYTACLEYSVPSPPFISSSIPPGKVGIRVDARYHDRFTNTETGWDSNPFEFYVDSASPTLSINSPSEGTVVKAGTEGFLIDVTASGDVGIQEFTIKVDGIVRDTINPRGNRVPSLRQNLRAMVFGTERRMITVVAKDNVDRTAERSFFVYSDGDPPTISNIRPLPNAPGNSYKTTASRVGLSVDILDRGMAGVKEVRLIDISETRIFDTRTRPYEGNRYILEAIRPSGTGTRIQQYYIQAFDKVGNMSQSGLITVVWEEPPLEIKKETIIPKQPVTKPPVK